MAKVTVETKLPLTNGKEADLTLENGEVRFKFPVSWDRPTATLADLRVALGELEAAACHLHGPFETRIASDAA